MVSKPKKAQSIKPIEGHELLHFVSEIGIGMQLCTCQVFQTDMVFAPEEPPTPIESCPYK